MADAKITDLPDIGGPPAFNDLISIVDVDDTTEDPSGTTKRITIADLRTMLALAADPAAADPNSIRIYSKSMAGRILPKWMPPSGIDTTFQPALFGNNIVFWTPNTGTVGTGVTFGSFFTSAGTVTHPTPSAGITNQIRRTRWANVVTTTNQELGTKAVGTGLLQFWRGNAAGLGGFFFACRFIIGLWPANTCRLFVGLASATGSMVASNTLAGDLVGLWHDTTDGANVLSLATMNNVSSAKTAITGATLAAGQGFDFYLWGAPNGSLIGYRLVSLNTATEIVNTTFNGATIPRNTIFMGPHVTMSNGTANITANTVAIDLARLYIESDN